MRKPFSVFRRQDAKLDFVDGAVNGAMLHRMVDETYSDEIGAGMFRINNRPDDVVLPYDEIAYCFEGTLKLTVDGVLHELKPGDFAWIPKNTRVIFDGDDATAFYGVYPVDWRTRNEAK